jgi:hypothetical protein
MPSMTESEKPTMKLARSHAFCRCLGCTLLVVVNVLHAAIHGTPLDGGVFDALLPQIDQVGYFLMAQAD